MSGALDRWIDRTIAEARADERRKVEHEMRARELHHFEAEKALTDVLALSHAITRDSHCSHLGADIRALLPDDITNPENRSQ